MLVYFEDDLFVSESPEIMAPPVYMEDSAPDDEPFVQRWFNHLTRQYETFAFGVGPPPDRAAEFIPQDERTQECYHLYLASGMSPRQSASNAALSAFARAFIQPEE